MNSIAQLEAFPPAAETPVKRRAACDECRFKKLKCTGEQPSCSRCVRERIQCIYSPQKQMGRPKKRRKSNAEDEDEHMEADTTQDSLTTPQVSWIQDMAHGRGLDDLFTVSSPDIMTCRTPWEIQQASNWMASQKPLPLQQTTPDLIPDESDGSSPATGTQDPMSIDVPATFDLELHQDAVVPAQQPANPSESTPIACACLSTMYLTLSSLQSMSEPFTFPYCLQPLRQAMQSTAEILHCEMCPMQFLTGMQNTQAIGSLVTSLAERFDRVLGSITREATRAEQAGERKKFCLADLSAANSHLHTGGLNCAAQFSVDLSPAEWRTMSKKVVRTEIYGSQDGAECCPYLAGLLDQMRTRQARWHAKKHSENVPQVSTTAPTNPNCASSKDDYLCLKMVGWAESLVEKYDWT